MGHKIKVVIDFKTPGQVVLDTPHDMERLRRIVRKIWSGAKDIGISICRDDLEQKGE